MERKYPSDFTVFARLRERHPKLKVVFGDSADVRNGLPQWVGRCPKILLRTVLRPAGLQGFTVLPKRWMVERTFGWRGRRRRHSKDYERKPETSETLITISMIALMLRRLAKADNVI